MPGEKPRLENPAAVGLTSWQNFYQSVRDPSWPDCDDEAQFGALPDWIREECCKHGYVVGQYRDMPHLAQRIFPIKTATACQLKWTWSTVFLTTGVTSSCHRTNKHRFDTESFDFHNTPVKIDDRQHMLKGLWPQQGCSYCKDIESAGGQSDRMTNLDMSGIHAPPELEHDLSSVKVTPRILEVYFDNTCNLKCVYCGPAFSSLWVAENARYGDFKYRDLVLSANWRKDSDIAKNKNKLFAWIKKHGSALTNFNILGGEPLYQQDLDQCLDFFGQYPHPHLSLQIFSNLNATSERLGNVLDKVHNLITQNRIARFTVTASLDCWGPPQEYARYPLKLETWQRNFETLVSQDWLHLVVGSTITPLTIHTLPDLIQKLNQYRAQRKIGHYFNSVNSPSYMFIDILGDIFLPDFDRAISIAAKDTLDDANIVDYLQGIKQQSSSKGVNEHEVNKLSVFLDEMDRRRNMNWQHTFPWLVDPIKAVVDQK